MVDPSQVADVCLKLFFALSLLTVSLFILGLYLEARERREVEL